MQYYVILVVLSNIGNIGNIQSVVRLSLSRWADCTELKYGQYLEAAWEFSCSSLLPDLFEKY